MHKLIAIDLDGTLLDDNKKISKENIDIINEIIIRGYEVVIATGRRYWSAKELTKEIDCHMTILANNGNIIRNSFDDKIIISKYLNIDDFRLVVEEGKKRNLNPMIHVNRYEEGYDIIIEFDKNHESYCNYLQNNNRYKQVNNFIDIDEHRILAVVYVGNKDELNLFKKILIEKYPYTYNIHIIENIAIAEALLEIMNPLGSKWQSLYEYAREKDILPDEIIAIGDDNNDIDMIKNAGLGIAMKNASEEVKSVASIITKKGNNESGVAFELKRVLDI